MSGITQKKDFNIHPQKRNSDEKIVVATASNSKEVFNLLTSNVQIPHSDFFRNYRYDLGTDKETLKELFSISDRTYQYWSNESASKPRVNQYAIVLLTLNKHPDLRVERR